MLQRDKLSAGLKVLILQIKVLRKEKKKKKRVLNS